MSDAPTDEAEVARLRRQVAALFHTESELHKTRARLDRQLRLFSRLHELSVGISRGFNARRTMHQVARFAVSNLAYERCVVLWRPQETNRLTVGGSEGYDRPARELLSKWSLSVDDPLPSGIREHGKLVYEAGAAEPSARRLAEDLDLAAFVAFALMDTGGRLLGLLVAGCSPTNQSGLEIIHDDLATSGLTSLAAQTAAALDNIRSHLALQRERDTLEERVATRTRDLAQALRELEDLDRAKTLFFANVSHELRTPLTLSIGPLEQILAWPADQSAPPHRDALRIVYRNQLRLLRLINNLLEVARIDANKGTARFKQTDLAQTMRFYAETVSAAAAARNIELEVTSQMKQALAFVDPELFERIAMNLLSNAFKFTGDGGRIDVRIGEVGSNIEIAVADTGVGIPPDALANLFDRFERVESGDRRHDEGTGIGLSLVKEYMERHGGEVLVASRLGEGTTFTLRLPRGREHLPSDAVDEGEHVADSVAQHELADVTGARGAQLAANEEVPRASPATDGRPVVLVVDDVQDMRMFITGVLEGEFAVAQAIDGAAALELARTVQPDVIVSDVMMPRMNGYELCEAIRREEDPLCRVPVILLSARGETSDKIEGLSQGADDYLSKPFNAEELVTRIRTQLRLREQERSLAATQVALVEAQRRALEREIDVARRVQAGILPSARHVILDGVEVCGFLTPATACSGDFWTHRTLPSGAMLVALADVEGHGLGSAMMTELIYGAMNAFLRDEEELDPAELLTRLNGIMCDLEGPAPWMTMVIGLLYPTMGTSTWSSAGHPPVLVRTGDTVTTLEGRQPPLGCDKDAKYTLRHVDCGAPTTFLLYSDGLVEATNRAGRRFGLRRLSQAFASAPVAPRESLGQIRDCIETFRAGEGFEDDVSAIVAQMR